MVHMEFNLAVVCRVVAVKSFFLATVHVPCEQTREAFDLLICIKIETQPLQRPVKSRA